MFYLGPNKYLTDYLGWVAVIILIFQPVILVMPLPLVQYWEYHLLSMLCLMFFAGIGGWADAAATRKYEDLD